MRILVVEDETDLAEGIADGLRGDGYAVDIAADGTSALEQLAHTPYDLVCLDVLLPDVRGDEVCRRLKSGGAAAPSARVAPRVLMLTALDAVGSRIHGLDAGADDYLVKPFDFDELAARIRALLRRDAGRSGAVLTCGDLVLDTAGGEAWRDGRPLGLSRKEFALLRYFMTHEGRAIPAEELIDHVWDAHLDPFSQIVKVAVLGLRRKLAPDGADQPLVTVRGHGYQLRSSS
ncbi:response regulator transcription factor [Streptomyces aureoverticillatus]|uniref:response regulator transcription factor n=1 Tax=Streptomyces aureoverticillatus TaxID=66871 RepID=UPI0013D8E36F|nr:response regulator transcription factor [Streptomyces aureoverticillatus]QIB48120.1 response regulator transcription factor [Streptomyces aureoverticillatus]